jgi:hypothetical protein
MRDEGRGKRQWRLGKDEKRDEEKTEKKKENNVKKE